MSIEIMINGVSVTVTKAQLFKLAENGTVTPEMPINVDGKLVLANQVKGITFGTPQTPDSSRQTNTSHQNDSAVRQISAGYTIASPAQRLLAFLLDKTFYIAMLLLIIVPSASMFFGARFYFEGMKLAYYSPHGEFFMSLVAKSQQL